MREMKEYENQIAIIVEAARLYYEHNFSQQQIADKLGNLEEYLDLGQSNLFISIKGL